MPDIHAGEAVGTEKIAIRHKRGISLVADKALGLRGVDQWESIMRKFHNSHKPTCKATPKEIPTVQRSLKVFPTKSTYEGSWNSFGIGGKGKYTFPFGDASGRGEHHSVTYEGSFEDGMFNGEGKLHYSCGATLKGKFKKGEMIERTLTFDDGLEYTDKKWLYCKGLDRRFTIEYDEGIRPAGNSFATAEQPTKEIPPGFFDSGNGFYDPVTNSVFKYTDLTAIIRSPSQNERKWMTANYRMNPSESLGPAPFLYEYWLEPSLEAEDTPPPSSRTKNYQEEIVEREVCFVGSRNASRVLSRMMSVSLFPGMKIQRRFTELDAYSTNFYNPSYLRLEDEKADGKQKRQSISSRMLRTRSEAMSHGSIQSKLRMLGSEFKFGSSGFAGRQSKIGATSGFDRRQSKAGNINLDKRQSRTFTLESRQSKMATHSAPQLRGPKSEGRTEESVSGLVLDNKKALTNW